MDAISSRFGVRTLELRRNPSLPGKPSSNPGQPAWLSDLTMLHAKPDRYRWGRTEFYQRTILLIMMGCTIPMNRSATFSRSTIVLSTSKASAG
jgi:hypothetical protein